MGVFTTAWQFASVTVAHYTVGPACLAEVHTPIEWNEFVLNRDCSWGPVVTNPVSVGNVRVGDDGVHALEGTWVLKVPALVGHAPHVEQRSVVVLTAPANYRLGSRRRRQRRQQSGKGTGQDDQAEQVQSRFLGKLLRMQGKRTRIHQPLGKACRSVRFHRRRSRHSGRPGLHQGSRIRIQPAGHRSPEPEQGSGSWRLGLRLRSSRSRGSE